MRLLALAAALASAWPQFRGDAGLTGAASTTPPAPLKVLWTYEAGEAIDSSAAIAEALDANAFGVCSATPYLVAPNHPGGSAVHVSLIVLTGDRVDPAALRTSIRVSVDGDQVTVRLPDGERIEVGAANGAVTVF